MDEPLVETWQIHDRINHYLLDAIPEEGLWASLAGKCRTVSDLFSHVHNVRLMWPGQVGRTRVAGRIGEA